MVIAVAAVAQRLATIMENSAKQNAAWTDRTGNARSGLFGTSESNLAAHLVVIYLSHGPVIDYGVYLELRMVVATPLLCGQLRVICHSYMQC